MDIHHIDALFVVGISTAAYAIGGTFWMGVGIATAVVVLGMFQTGNNE